MRVEDLPSPRIGGKGHLLRTSAASALSQLQVAAPGYGGKHPAATDLSAFFAACATAVSALISGGAGGSTPPVVPGVVHLSTLVLSGPLVPGTASTGTILGATNGEAISTTFPGLTVNSPNRTYAWDGTGTSGATGNLVSTLAGADNSGLQSPIAAGLAGLLTNVAVAAVAVPDAKTFGPTDTGSAVHFVQCAFSNQQYDNFLKVGMNAAGVGAYIKVFDGLTFYLCNQAGQIFNSVQLSRQIANGEIMQVRVALDASIGLYVNDVYLGGFSATTVSARFGTLGTYVGAFSNPNDMTSLAYGVPSSPITISLQTLTTNYRPKATLSYTNPAGTPPTGYQVRARTPDGATVLVPWEDCALVSNPAAGTALVEGITPIPAGQAGVMPLVDYRQKNNTAVTATRAIYRPRPMKFGTNSSGILPYDSRRAYANLLMNGYWQYLHSTADVSPNLDADGYYNGTFNNDLVRTFSRPDTSGAEVEFTWTGDPNAVWDFGTPEGAVEITNWRVVSPGVIRYTRTFNPEDHSLNYLHCSSFDTANPPKNLDMREVGMDKGLRFAPSYVAFKALWAGFPLRTMDLQNINNAYAFTGPWSARPLRTNFASTTNLNGMPIEDIIELCNATNRPLWLNIPPFASNSYIDGLISAVFTGAGTSNGVALRADLAAELLLEDGNEWWNAAFPLYGYAREQALASGRATQAQHDDGGGYGAVVIEQVFQHKRVMSRALSAAGANAGKIVRVLAAQQGIANINDLLATGIGSADYDAASCAPYWGSPNAGNVGSDLATLETTWRAGMTATMDSLLVVRDIHVANGKRLVCYEGGPDNGSSGLTVAQAKAWYRSPGMYRVFKEWLLRFKAEFGDVICVFNDTGEGWPLYPWGMEEFAGSTQSQRLLAANDVLAILHSETA